MTQSRLNRIAGKLAIDASYKLSGMDRRNDATRRPSAKYIANTVRPAIDKWVDNYLQRIIDEYAKKS